jgi:hypothetical protein
MKNVKESGPVRLFQGTEQLDLLVRRDGLDQRHRSLLVEQFEDVGPAFELGLVQQLSAQVEGESSDYPSRRGERQLVERLSRVRRPEILAGDKEVLFVARQQVEELG